MSLNLSNPAAENAPKALLHEGLSAKAFAESWPADQVFVDLDLIDYEKALEIQTAFLDRIHQNGEAGFIITCRHPAVITLGRATKNGDITTWSGPQIQVSRGGRVTYHGPSQVVVYPIVNLTHASPVRAARDIHAFIRALENCVTTTLKDFNIEAQGKSGDHDTGIWVGDRKVASIGIAVRHWITYHGAAINLENDPTAFQGIRPCGLESSTMTSIAELLPHAPTRVDFIAALKTQLRQLLP